MRLIDADAFAEEMKNRQESARRWAMEATDNETAIRADAVLRFLSEVKLTLDEMPTIDAVPVVRCKDCRHHHDSFGEEYCHRSYTPMPVSAEWFCPRGERKDDEADNL